MHASICSPSEAVMQNIGVTRQCDGCITTHIHAARTKGATAEEDCGGPGRFGGQPPRGIASGGWSGYGDRTLLTRDSKLVMARDFWR
jgi:hypothetical protein